MTEIVTYVEYASKGPGDVLSPIPFSYATDEDGNPLVTVYSDGVERSPSLYSWSGASEITLGASFPVSALVRVVRETPIDAVEPELDGSSALDFEAINENFNKTFQALEEHRDLLSASLRRGFSTTIAPGYAPVMGPHGEYIQGFQAGDIGLAQTYAAQAAVSAAAAINIMEVNIRESRFAGGAKMNGIDDDRPAIQAAINWAKGLGDRYNGGSVRIRLPSGLPRVESTLDVTGANNVELYGDGDGRTTLRGINNVPIINSNDVSAAPLYRFKVADMTIYGPGYTNGNAYGIRLGSNNNCEIKARVWACRRGISLANSWQTTLNNIRIDGQGSALRCYDGLYLEDGEAAVVENAVLCLGGQIQGTFRYGLRGESVTGSKIFGLEVVGCDGNGVYLGDSPGNKPLKWFTWVGGLIDTCPMLLTVKKGGSAVAELLHFSGIWMGYAFQAGNGTGAEFVGISDFTFSPDIIVNTVYAMNVQDCVRANISAETIKDYDRLVSGAPAIIVNGTVDSRFTLGTMKKTSGSPSGNSLVEQNTAARNIYQGANADGLIATLAANGSRTIGCRTVVSGASIALPDHGAEFAKAALPVASTFWKGRTVMVIDEAGGYVPAFCDGTNWRRVTDRAIVS